MATHRQRKAAELVAKGGSAKAALMKAGYKPTTAKTPAKVLESKSFLDLCDELGLTDDLVVKSLVDDIRAKPGDRKPELELAAKIRGRLNQIDIEDSEGIFGQATKLTIEFADAPQAEPDAGSSTPTPE